MASLYSEHVTWLVILLFVIVVQSQDISSNPTDKKWTEACQKSPEFKIEKNLAVRMCLFWSKIATTFAGAKVSCAARGARLAVFKGEAKMEILFRQRKIWYRNIWIGLDDIDQEGMFVWHDGTTLNPMDYYPLYFNRPNPNNYKNMQHCVYLWTEGNKLDDSVCGIRFYYVCEKVIT
ncbi:CD209 antigen [Biomphalaria pfeifferi]|uniref:CD209 antigen n=1 Tax=Biomphalaria pfeifferi TaxID=112525 RepID=A0AAD8EXW7_BIOPF|nr:CD209 antigen [Biomphalaria pfeifferi]